METPFENDPFAIVWEAFKEIYPDKKCTCMWVNEIENTDDGKPAYGFTDFQDDGNVYVCVSSQLEVGNAVEILAHELAHVAVGSEAEHGEKWQEAFDNIFQEYNWIAKQMFGEDEE